MSKRLNLRKIFLFMSAMGAISISPIAHSAGFYLWEQDAASIGNYHAGTAAEASDASTAWYNPAGLIRIKNQQLIVGADPVLTNFKYRGTVGVNTIIDLATFSPAEPRAAAAQGGGFNLVPFGHYAAPISDCFVFGLSVGAPFGLKTSYGDDTFTRYAATLTKLQVIDITPSLGFKINDKLSVGAGFDVQKLSAELNLVTTLGTTFGPEIISLLDTTSHNEASDYGYGWRLGALYQFTPATRVGINYRSRVIHHARGSSTYRGPLADNGVRQHSGNLRATAILPAVTSVSLFHSFNPCWDVMSSVTYTQWNVFQDLVLHNVAGINAAGVNSNEVVVDVINRYRNVWNYSVGANYHPSEKWILRTGLGYDQSPARNAFRNLQIPDSDRIAMALGAHYQATKTLGFDAGWTHLFAANARINTSQIFGPEVVTTRGKIAGSADVYGLQLKWDIV